jgi:lipid-binding SYLF domain-containing protein
MKILLTSLCVLGLAGTALAVDKSDLDVRIRKLTMKFAEMQTKADKRVPADVLRKARGIVLLDRTKAGFIFAYQGGSGIALAKGAKEGQWSAPAFLNANEASLGFQIGGQQSFIVILLMNTNAVRLFAQGNFSFGGEASGTAGNAHATAEGVTSPTEKVVMIYTDKEGLYGGAAIKGDAIAPDEKADFAYYGEFFSMHEILCELKGKPSATSTELTRKIDESSK